VERVKGCEGERKSGEVTKEHVFSAVYLQAIENKSCANDRAIACRAMFFVFIAVFVTR
jgi:hypothetical protein